jgi:hypothetical protein
LPDWWKFLLKEKPRVRVQSVMDPIVKSD